MADDELRMRAYYYGFTPTGVRDIDLILHAVACAGMAFHNTEQWTDDIDCYYNDCKGSTPQEWIQNAANEAANKQEN